MAKYMASAGIVRVSSDAAVAVSDKLRPAVYTVTESENQGIFLTERPPLPSPAEVFGRRTLQRVDKVLNTYGLRKNTPTGVLLSGVKGSGKSMLVRLIANKALSMGYPVLLLDVTILNSDIVKFINSIDTPCVVVLEELDKLRLGSDKAPVECTIACLQLLDGTGASAAHLFLATANDTLFLYDKLLARPGRIYYHFQFGEVPEDVCRAYLEAKFSDAAVRDAVYEAMLQVPELTFDIMSAFVEEVLRYGHTDEDLACCLKDLNLYSASAANICGYKAILRQHDRVLGETDCRLPATRLICSNVSFRNYELPGLLGDLVEGDADADIKACAARIQALNLPMLHIEEFNGCLDYLSIQLGHPSVVTRSRRRNFLCELGNGCTLELICTDNNYDASAWAAQEY